MKKPIFSLIMMLAAAIALLAFTYTSGPGTNPPQDKPATLFPEDVQKVLENSCFDCHSDAASNIKAKTKLNLSNWNDYSDSKKVGKMQDINDELQKGAMPPEKYVTNYPDHAPTQADKETLYKWITEESAKLMGE